MKQYFNFHSYFYIQLIESLNWSKVLLTHFQLFITEKHANIQ